MIRSYEQIENCRKLDQNLKNVHVGIHYFSQLYLNEDAQFSMTVTESTFPSHVTEREGDRVVTEHTVEIFWEFQGSAEVSVENILHTNCVYSLDRTRLLFYR